MEPEGSLPHLQDPSTCPYPEPDQSSPCPPYHFLKIHVHIIVPSTPWIGTRKNTRSSLLSVTSQLTSVATVSYSPAHICRCCWLLPSTHLSLLSVTSQLTSVATVSYSPTHICRYCQLLPSTSVATVSYFPTRV